MELRLNCSCGCVGVTSQVELCRCGTSNLLGLTTKDDLGMSCNIHYTPRKKWHHFLVAWRSLYLAKCKSHEFSMAQILHGRHIKLCVPSEIHELNPSSHLLYKCSFQQYHVKCHPNFILEVNVPKCDNP